MSIGDLPLNPKPIKVRKVYAANVESEFDLLGMLIDNYTTVAMDTEFPGVVVRSEAGASCLQQRSQSASYYLLKANVDMLSIIQIGFTLTDSSGNLPDLGTGFRYIWEFNFRDFDVTRDSYNSRSVEMLEKQGIDFEKNRKFGIESLRFAELMLSSGLVCNDAVSWVTFHSGYDFGYLLKILTQVALPAELEEFHRLLRVYFGPRVFDMKHMMRFCSNLHGGLDRVAKALVVDRVVGERHQAGSDSLLTLHVFQKMMAGFFCDDDLDKFAGVLYGLELS